MPGATWRPVLSDPIVAEVRRIRAEIAQECGYNLERIAAQANEATARATEMYHLRRISAADWQKRRDERGRDRGATDTGDSR
jgi:hypothetical protein